MLQRQSHIQNIAGLRDTLSKIGCLNHHKDKRGRHSHVAERALGIKFCKNNKIIQLFKVQVEKTNQTSIGLFLPLRCAARCG